MVKMPHLWPFFDVNGFIPHEKCVNRLVGEIVHTELNMFTIEDCLEQRGIVSRCNPRYFRLLDVVQELTYRFHELPPAARFCSIILFVFSSDSSDFWVITL